ncbi:hypothetical protein AB0436_02630 [Streptomyces sp. NPDC051322]|uniref:hypothetical protein n=1 Tax=Streptomyces sp. NPDC051322 TaxID=3154645 RepID=UPI0034508EB5
MPNVIGVVVFAGFFALGWMAFNRKIRLPSPRKPSSFARNFPKLWGGFFMACAVNGAVGTILTMLGYLHGH